MDYQRIEFTAGREGAGYLEVPSSGAPRLLDVDGQPITECVVEYHIVDVAPARQTWMIET